MINFFCFSFLVNNKKLILSDRTLGEGLVELFLIDHGETVVAHIHDLRELPPAVVALPRLVSKVFQVLYPVPR